MIIPNELIKREHCLYSEWYEYKHTRDVFIYRKNGEEPYRLAQKISAYGSTILKIIASFKDIRDAVNFANIRYRAQEKRNSE